MRMTMTMKRRRRRREMDGWIRRLIDRIEPTMLSIAAIWCDVMQNSTDTTIIPPATSP
jgi:hypothetical protein